MSFQPVVPLGGYTGWLFLQRTADTQKAAFNDSAPVQRATETFREKIGDIKTAEQLVNDRELLSVALGAFGLDEDLNNTYFIQKILEEGTTDDDALANRLADPRYAAFSDAFGFGTIGGVGRTGYSFFADEIIDRYEAKQFEKAVGNQNNDMRLALNLGPALDEIVEAGGTNNGQWFGMMGNKPLRSLVQTALGFPSSFAAIDLDKQLEQFKERAQATFGTDTLADLTEPENQEKLIRLYMLRSQSNAFAGTSSASIALTLLQQS
ncbi:DUF1217 domain-containing protein [Thalassorhabdomicrobium marinisediminis]|uniref:DUF1217 domain-containing protein n=1 Tax=Thalassorhabdomicrobium marinisediminis TaxID=2170577 RepID=UPI002490B71D|nr:DUF1217 domain-containing protein [Thalassorhabdomicrobium marinisediminis]